MRVLPVLPVCLPDQSVLDLFTETSMKSIHGCSPCEGQRLNPPRPIHSSKVKTDSGQTASGPVQALYYGSGEAVQ